MPDDTNEHFFACDLLWWSLRVSFCRSELLHADALTERLAEYNERLETLGAWLIDELVRAGPSYLIDGRARGISSVDPIAIEQRLRDSLKALEELAASMALTAESRASCVYVAESSWVVAILRAFVDFEQKLSSDEASARYRTIAGEVAELIEWIEAQRDEVVVASSLGTLEDAISPAIAAAAQAWCDDVRAHSARYPRV